MKYDPWSHAEDLGISVIEGHVRTGNGLWIPDYNTIVIQRRMRVGAKRITLTHEIGHAVHGHRDSRPKHEHQANLYAGERLIDPERLRDVVGWTHHPFQIAQEVGVTTTILHAYIARHLPDLRAA